MKKKLKLTSLNEGRIEKLEVEKLQGIKGGRALKVMGTCEDGNNSCTNDEEYHDKYKDA